MAHFPGKILSNVKQSKLSIKNYVRFNGGTTTTALLVEEKTSVDILTNKIEKGLKTFYFLFSSSAPKDDCEDEKSFDGFSQTLVNKRREEILTENCQPGQDDNQFTDYESDESGLEDDESKLNQETNRPTLVHTREKSVDDDDNDNERFGSRDDDGLKKAQRATNKEELINDVSNCQTLNLNLKPESRATEGAKEEKPYNDNHNIGDISRKSKSSTSSSSQDVKQTKARLKEPKKSQEHRRKKVDLKNGSKSESIPVLSNKDSLRNCENNGSLLRQRVDTRASSPSESLSSPSSGQSCASAAKKEAIRRHMAARYAEKMMSEGLNGMSDGEEKKKLDQDESVKYTQKLSKIEKLLKSQWEERLKKQGDFVAQEDDGRHHSSSPLTGSGTTTTTTTMTGGQPPVAATTNNTSVTPEPIIRKAKLQLNSKTLLKLRQPSSLKHLIFDESNAATPSLTNEKEGTAVKKKTSNGGRPGYITCAICNITKYYSHVQRRHGQYSCEPCSKFFARFCRNPKQLYCTKNGDCPISGDQQQPIATSNKCRACWLKLCLQKFIIDPSVREHISANYAPKLESSPNVSLIAVDTSQGHNLIQEPLTTTKESSSLLMLATESEDGSGFTKSINSRRTATTTASSVRNISASGLTTGNSNSTRSNSKNGPRVKRVCRSVDVIKGLPRATFSAGNHRGDNNNIQNETYSSSSCSSDDDNDSDDIPIDVYICRAYEKEMKEKKLSQVEDDGLQRVETGVNSE